MTRIFITNINARNHHYYRTSSAASKHSFSTLFQNWHRHVLSPSLAISTVARYNQEVDLRLSKSQLMDMYLLKIKSCHIQEMYSTWMAQGASVNSIRIIHNILSGFFRYCLKADLLIKNPMEAVCLPKNRQIKKAQKISLQREDIWQIVRYAQKHSKAFIFVFAIFTGLRQGDAYVKQKTKKYFQFPLTLITA